MPFYAQISSASGTLGNRVSSRQRPGQETRSPGDGSLCRSPPSATVGGRSLGSLFWFSGPRRKSLLSPFPGGGWILTFCSTLYVVWSFQGPGDACPVIFRRLGFSVLIGFVPYPQHSDTLRIANKSLVFLKAQIAKRACYCFM